jgi:carbon storage regulator
LDLRMWRSERMRSMLVLTRKIGQSVMIGDSVQVTLVEIRGDQVRLGITAPLSVSVRRKELAERDMKADTPRVSDAAKPDSDR